VQVVGFIIGIAPIYLNVQVPHWAGGSTD